VEPGAREQRQLGIVEPDRGSYTTTVSNNGVQFPTTRDTQVITIMATMSGAKPDVNMVYPPIGPYTSGLIRLFDPTVAADRTAAQSIFSPTNGSDYCVRVVQGGVHENLHAGGLLTDIRQIRSMQTASKPRRSTCPPPPVP
jgi:hypothetical protein